MDHFLAQGISRLDEDEVKLCRQLDVVERDSHDDTWPPGEVVPVQAAAKRQPRENSIGDTGQGESHLTGLYFY